MKKFFAVCIIGLFLGTAGAFADHPDGWGIGLVGRGGYGWGGGGGGLALSLKAPPIPVYWGINLDLYTNYFGFGVTGDYYFLEGLIVPDIGFGYFIGVGGYLNMGFYDETYGSSWHRKYTTLGFGVRVPLGINFVFPISKFHLEIFLDIAPSIGLGMTFTDKESEYYKHDGHSNEKFLALGWGIGGELGVRFWF
ncbi:MAG: DUF3996 domain-containing protein [Treponema sp.]|jgi:hypothetical protein|nr:DUF3996 domain-containing protein [Treponema sp.]